MRRQSIKSSTPSEMSTEDIISSLEVEFEFAGDDVIADDGLTKFTKFESKLKRTADWNDRLQAVTRIAALCKGTNNVKQSAAEFRTIVTSFVECLTDARSTLMKGACLALVTIAKSLKNHLDTSSFFIIPQLLDKTNNGAAVIAYSARFAVVNYVKYVYGKNTKATLENGITSPSEEARLTTLQAMIATISSWPESYSGRFQYFINQARTDKSSKIRSLASEYANEDSVSVFSTKSTASKIPIHKSKITDSTSSKKSGIPTKTPARDNGVTPSKIPRCAFNGTTPLRVDNGMTPLKPLSVLSTKSVKRAKEDDGKTPMKRHSDATEDFIPDPEPFEDHEVTPEQKQTLDDIIAKSDIESLRNYIKQESPDLFGFLPPIIDILIAEMQKSSQISADFLTDLCNFCASYLIPYVIDILTNLPSDEAAAKSIINVLSTAYGKQGVIRLLYSSEQPFVMPIILENALDNDDIDDQVRAVLATIKRDQYKNNVALVIDILQKIYEANKKLCIRTILNIPDDMRKSVLVDVETKLPELDEIFNGTEQDTIISLLQKEMMNAKTGKPVDIEVLQEGMYDEKTQTILITIIKEAKEFNPEYVPLLVLLTEESEEVASYAGSVLKDICEQNPQIVNEIADIFSPTHGCFVAFTGLIGKADKESVIHALELLKDQMIASLEIEDLRRDVLDVIAATVVNYGNEFHNFLGELDQENIITLDACIRIRENPNEDI
ncbi:hypothetical protein TVAG_151060 [Trichomonas vaginalis G3]|uniref:Uncharacterized protein n=1 Tax=Trichomonas vaginalis (strain ATCC PRA-98 / G3) TaxID=412133 RepID=A2FM18_TRIV3|nr:microtubule binding CLASP family [Trichomonas vaginalis G3]EAX94059.1 hypothetical protein TVAG_151060 [Trichomonas vaginalis G3]KAI5548211.1 microtubule binding CLASP family [Trichomonas vaginalis G3]|eukprot:XP_001306989.1 hypothetical protein [Trichomonas vaginalis G3]